MKSKMGLVKALVASTACLLLAAQCSTASLSSPNAEATLSGVAWYSYGVSAAAASLVTKKITIRNSGDADAVLGTVTNQGLALEPPFFLTGGTCTTGAVIPADGGTCTLEIAFAPSHLGHVIDRFQLLYNWEGNGPVSQVFSMGLTGTASDAGALLSISDGPEYDFGRKAIGLSTTKTFTVANTGMTAANTTSIVAVGTNSVFSVTGGSCGANPTRPGIRALTFTEAAAASPAPGSPVLDPIILPLNPDSCTVDVTYTPVTTSPAVGTLYIGYVWAGSGQPNSSVSRTLKGSSAPFIPVTSISAGSAHTCAVFSSGSVRCWGADGYGQLGYGTGKIIGDDEEPWTAGDVNVGGEVAQIATGREHTCALLSNGHVRCWGQNVYGQLGYGHTIQIGDDETPASAGDVNVGGDVRQIAAGGEHTCALLTTGKVRCWGHALYGALGYGNLTTIGDNEPPAAAGDVDVGGPVSQIAAADAQTCAVLTTGAVRCWGNGQLGYVNQGTIGDDETPASAGDISVGGPVTQIATSSTHTCAVLTTGKVRCWGEGGLGALGYGNFNSIGDNEPPSAAGDVDVGGAVTQVAVGMLHTCALLTNGKVRCWGLNNTAQLGYPNLSEVGGSAPPSSAGDVGYVSDVKQITAGSLYTCALTSNGVVHCWGLPEYGELGYGTGYGVNPADPVPLY